MQTTRKANSMGYKRRITFPNQIFIAICDPAFTHVSVHEKGSRELKSLSQRCDRIHFKRKK